MESDSIRLPEGRQPYDSINGLRVGALVGGLLGAVVGALTHIPWLLVVGAVAGGAAGFWSQRHKLRGARDERPPPADNGS